MMKLNNHPVQSLSSFLGIFAPLTLIVASPASAVTSPASQSFIAQGTQVPPESLNIDQLGQEPSTPDGYCRRVAVAGGMYIRSEPSVYSTPITVVDLGETVTVAGSEIEGWLAVSEPVEGYIFSRYLEPCQETNAVLPDNCREVTRSLTVYNRPTEEGETLGYLSSGEWISIQTYNSDLPGASWALVSQPLRGYVPMDGLTECNASM